MKLVTHSLRSINRAQIKRLEKSEIGLLKEVLEIMIDKQDKMPQ